MWEVLVRTPLGTVSKRKLVMLVATFMVTIFGYLFINPTDAYAADAQWNGSDISYNAKDFTGPLTAKDNDRTTLPKDTIYYATYDATDSSSSTRPKGYLIYFPQGTDTSKATTALYSTAEYNPATGRFSNLSPPDPLSLDASTYNSQATLQPSTCDVDGIGWVICPVSNWIAKGMDGLYGLIESYLNFTPLTGGDNGIYQMWDIVRNVANIMFTIGFLVLIYSQITGSIFSNYTLKKMLPRVIIAAVLVNTSYWICAVGVDISNVAGASVQQLFMNMFDQLGASNSAADDIGWEKVTAIALGGGSLAAVGLIGATALNGGAMAFAIIAALIPALFAVFVAIIILAARQALITILIILAPLAFAAYLLPNTEEWFGRWRKFFISLLVMFPAFAVVFGGSQLAGKLIIQNASNLSVVILGLVVQVVPLFVTPFLIKLSSGLLSTIIGLTNDKSKGVFDGAQNWAKGNQQAQRSAAISRGLSRLEKSPHANKRWRRFGSASYIATGGQRREALKGRNDEAIGSYVDSQVGRSRAGNNAYDRTQRANMHKADAHAANELSWRNRLMEDDDRTYSSRTQFGQRREAGLYSQYRHMAHETHANETSAGILKDSLHDEGERHFREGIANADAGSYNARIRERQIKSIEDKGVAENAKKYVEAQGSAALKRVIAGTPELSRQVAQTVEFEKTAQQYETIVQKAAEAAYDNASQSNPAIREIRLRATAATKDAENAEANYNAYVDEIKTIEGAKQHNMTNDQSVIQLQKASEGLRVQTQRAGAAKRVADVEYAKQIQDDSTGLAVAAGGIEGATGVSQAKSVAFQTIVDAHNKGVAAEKTPLSRIKPSELLNSQYLGSAAILNEPTERISAIAGMIASGSHQESHIKLWERMSELQDIANAELSTAQQSGNQDAIRIAEDKIGKVKDLQQQVMGDKKKKPFGVGDFDLGEAEVGRYKGDVYESTRSRISTHLSAESLATMDPDDIRLIFEMAREGKLSNEQLQKVAKAYKEWGENDNLKGSLADKHKVLLDPIRDQANGNTPDYLQDDPKYTEVRRLSNP